MLRLIVFSTLPTVPSSLARRFVASSEPFSRPPVCMSRSTVSVPIDVLATFPRHHFEHRKDLLLALLLFPNRRLRQKISRGRSFSGRFPLHKRKQRRRVVDLSARV